MKEEAELRGEEPAKSRVSLSFCSLIRPTINFVARFCAAYARNSSRAGPPARQAALEFLSLPLCVLRGAHKMQQLASSGGTTR